MLTFLLRRAILAVLVCMTVLVISFSLTRLAGDPAMAVAGPQRLAADIEAVRKAYGLDRPVHGSSSTGSAAAAMGDLGDSYFFSARVAKLIGERMPITLTLGLTGLVIALLVSLPLGILAAVNENTAARPRRSAGRAARARPCRRSGWPAADDHVRPAARLAADLRAPDRGSTTSCRASCSPSPPSPPSPG